MKIKQNSLTIGYQMEQFACDYLKKQGLRLLFQNYRCKMGEIDLIMQDNQTIVFIEVRYRTRDRYGSSLETIHFTKQRKLMRTAHYYLLMQQKPHHPARFDVVAIDKVANEYTLHWLKNAWNDYE